MVGRQSFIQLHGCKKFAVAFVVKGYRDKKWETHRKTIVTGFTATLCALHLMAGGTASSRRLHRK